MLELACIIEKSPRTEQRRSDRVDLSKPASVRVREGGRESGVVENLSAGGCAICSSGFYPVGATVFVSIASFQPFTGRVVWRDDGRIGVEFDRPLHQAIVDHIGGSAAH
jgi:hypothetical protein